MKKAHVEWDEGKDRENQKNMTFLFHLLSMLFLILIASSWKIVNIAQRKIDITVSAVLAKAS